MKTARDTLSLDGIWDFHFDEGKGLEEAVPSGGALDDVMPVPMAFDVAPRYLRKRGLAMYRKRFTLREAWSGGLFRVGALGLSGRIWLDGEALGEAPLAYTAYAFETGPLAAGKHTLHVAVDNRLSLHTPFFKPDYDFYAFGGIYRSVTLERLPSEGPILERVHVRTVDWKEREVELEFVFRSCTQETVALEGAFDTESAPWRVEVKPAVAHTGRLMACVRRVVPSGALWTPDTPNLHTVRCTVVSNGDTVEETFGIREFRAEKDRFWLNGEPIKLMGFNRHESHPETGPAVPESVMMEDLHHLKELHCNFIRGSHYPQDERFLDLCDRLGFLVWEEGLAWGNGAATLGDPVFVENQVDHLRRMVRKSYNHPSVVIWAFLNEFDSACDEGVALCRRLVETIREEDTTRPISFACNRETSDRCVPLVDIASWNTYPGWIDASDGPQPEERIAPNRDVLVEHFLKNRKPGAPLFVSEMGCCGVYGQHDDAAAQWTEEFQVGYLRAVIRAVFERPEIQGLSIWQFTDCLSFHRIGGCIRTKPFAQNLAGVFDVYRRRKLAATTVQEEFARLLSERR